MSEKLPPVRERLEGLSEDELKILRYLVSVYKHPSITPNPVFVRQIKEELGMSSQKVTGILRKLQNRKLVAPPDETSYIYEGKRKIRLYWIINKATYEKLKKILGE